MEIRLIVTRPSSHFTPQNPFTYDFGGWFDFPIERCRHRCESWSSFLENDDRLKKDLEWFSVEQIR